MKVLVPSLSARQRPQPEQTSLCESCNASATPAGVFMASIGIRLTEDQKDFWFFGIADDGAPTQAYRGVEGLHRLLGELRTRLLRLVMRYLDSTRVREALQDISSGHWLVIDVDAGTGRHLTFASEEKVLDAFRYGTIAEVLTAIEQLAMPRFP